MAFGSCQIRAKAANVQNKETTVVEMLSLRLFLSGTRQNWKAVCVLLRWDGNDHLPLGVCSMSLFSCVIRACLLVGSQRPPRICFLWLFSFEIPQYHYLNVFRVYLSFFLLALCICSLPSRSLVPDLPPCCLTPVTFPFPQGIPSPSHANSSGLGDAANQMCQRFEAEITVVRCLLVPSPEAVFLLWKPHKTQNWKGPADH